MIEAYPLKWPEGWARTTSADRRRSKFGKWNAPVSVSRGISDVLNELKMLKATQVVVSTDMPLRKDGLPLSDRRDPVDPGAAVYFRLDGNDRCFPCDRWDRLGDNLRAIALSIEALRGLDRWGAKTMVDAAFRGFQALPPPDGSPAFGGTVKRTPWEVFGLPEGFAELDLIEARWKRLAKERHPDSPTGSEAAFKELKDAYDALRRGAS